MTTNSLRALRSRYAGRISAELRGREADEMARTARALMKEWNPILASESELRSLMGKPSRESPGIIEYVFDYGFSGERWRFGVRGGFVVSVEWEGLD
jgi:hypothetical protein